MSATINAHHQGPTPKQMESTWTWIDVGAHGGDMTLEQARNNPGLKVFAFEPNPRAAARLIGCAPNYLVIPMAIAETDGCADLQINAFEASSSLLPLVEESVKSWIGGEVLKVERTVTVPTIRLDTFMDLAGIEEVDFLKIDTQGMDLAVVRSAGCRLRDIAKIMLEVDITPTRLYRGAPSKAEVLDFLDHAGFTLAATEAQSNGQEENLTFVRRDEVGGRIGARLRRRGWTISPASEPMESSETTSQRDPEPTWPRISLVTPVRNSRKYIEQTIRSVLAQAYPNLEYFIVDGGSTDGTLDIVRKYEDQISGWISEPDNGMYDAINKGFARSSGEIMGWISATDQLHLGGLRVVGSVFRDLPSVEWITGRPTLQNEGGMTAFVLEQARWSRFRFLAGANRTIQQESTYWRRRLWERAGSHVDSSRRNAADFELWVRFFRHARLYPVDALIGGFRYHDDSLGLQDMEACYHTHDEYIEAELDSIPQGVWLRRFRRISRRMEPIPKVGGAWKRVVANSLYHLPGPDWPPVIEYCLPINRWIFRGGKVARLRQWLANNTFGLRNRLGLRRGAIKHDLNPKRAE